MRQPGLVQEKEIPRSDIKCETADVSEIPGRQLAVRRGHSHTRITSANKSQSVVLSVSEDLGCVLLLTKPLILGKFRNSPFIFTISY